MTTHAFLLEINFSRFLFKSLPVFMEYFDLVCITILQASFLILVQNFQFFNFSIQNMWFHLRSMECLPNFSRILS